MAEEVTLPQLGESVTEGVITQWLVEVGDTVEADQPLVEISTDKVDTEIPSPVSGTIQELKAEVDETVEVGQVIAIVGEEAPSADDDGAAEDGEAADETEAAEDGEPDDAAEEATETATEAAAPEETEQAAEDEAETRGEAASDRATAEAETGADTAPSAAPTPSGNGQPTAGDKALTSPLVRKMLREAGVDVGEVEGTGKGGRITREDAERAIAEGPRPADRGRAAEPAPAAATEAPRPQTRPERPEASPLQVDFGGERQVTQDLSRVRRAIAKAMHASLQETAQLTAAVEVDVTRIMQLRSRVKDAFRAQHGVSLSPLPFFARAACMTIPRHPAINGSIDLAEGTATFHSYINLGLAVDTERGLLVPNLKDAQDLNIPGLAKGIADIANKTRSGKGLTPDDIQGGTFTITNTGSRGTLFDTPILNPPEVAILATCAIEKRAVVIEDELGDSVAIRWMMYLCLTYDHRMIDGADAARFLQDLKWVIENHEFSSEVAV